MRLQLLATCLLYLTASTLALAQVRDESAARSNESKAAAARAAAAEIKATAQTGSSTAKPTREELEKRFAETMSNATLVGHFTDHTRRAAPLKEEKYTLGKVSKLNDDVWLFEARIQYGDHDVTLPLPLRVVWAGDTPVITLDKTPVPGFGTFTCRVMIFENQYAGTWDGANHGGHLFGKLERAEKKDRPAADSRKKDGEPKNAGKNKKE